MTRKAGTAPPAGETQQDTSKTTPIPPEAEAEGATIDNPPDDPGLLARMADEREAADAAQPEPPASDLETEIPPESVHPEDLVLPDAGPVLDLPVTTGPPLPVLLQGLNRKMSVAICEATKAIQTVGKDSENNFAHYKYASVDAFLGEVRGHLASNGLTVWQQPNEITTTAKHMVIRWEFYLTHVDGGWTGPWRRDSAAPIEMGPQAYGGAEAYGLKFFLRSMFLVAAEEPGEDLDSRRQQPLDQRRDPRPAQAQRQAPRPQQQPPRGGQHQSSSAPRTADMPPMAPPPDDGDAPGQAPLPMRSRGAAPPREARPFDTPVQRLKARIQSVGESNNRVAGYFGLATLEELNSDMLREANECIDAVEQQQKARREAEAAG